MAPQHAHKQRSTMSVTLGRAFVAGIILNSVFVVVEFISSLCSHSLALLSDAGHNLGDVATLALLLFAFQIAKKKANKRFTYGFQKGAILASLANAVILLIAVGSIGWEAYSDLKIPFKVKVL